MDNLYLDAKIILLDKIAAEYVDYVGMGLTSCPSEFVFKINCSDENAGVVRSARKKAFDEINNNGIKKYAFDTRYVDQECERNPRANLQYWNRSEPFITEEHDKKIKIFAWLMSVLEEMKNDLGREPEWLESYANVLHGTVERILRIKQADLNTYAPQISYLEQLISARYRMSMDDLVRLGSEEIRNILLAKDEALLKRGNFLKATGGFTKAFKENVLQSTGAPPQQVQYVERPVYVSAQPEIVEKSRRPSTGMGKADLNAIFAGSDFGGAGFRHDGERSCERVITIKIVDTVID